MESLRSMAIAVAFGLFIGGCGGGGQGAASLQATNETSAAAVPGSPASTGAGAARQDPPGPLVPVPALPPAVAQAAVANVVTITESEGVSTSDYPVQMGRVFVRGEIRGYPAAIVDGAPVLTQAEVKTRWDDGSVKHAVLSFHVPRIEARQTLRVAFGDQPTGNNEGALTAAQMLDARFGFDARVELSSASSTVAASARQMIVDGRMTRWLSGPIATSVILADHAGTRAYDLGFDSHRSFRPIVHATFWPRINKVFVRVIGEVSNVSALQAMNYDLRIGAGTANATAYAKTAVAQNPGMRWTRTFWLGGAPARLNIDNNLAYLASSGAVPNFDARLVVRPATVARVVSTAGRGREVMGRGDWTTDMWTTGGRNDLGLLPKWDVLWLYTGDAAIREISLSNSDLAGAWPMAFREAVAGRFFDPERQTPAIGLPISLYGRPTLITTQTDNPYTVVADRLVNVGPVPRSEWLPDMAHQPDPYSVPYLLTGDHWYLEQLQFWASWGALSTVHGSDISWGRGPTHSSGNINNQVRGEGWGLRTRVLAAWLSPDGSPEKRYFERLIRDVIAIWEGKRRIQGTAFEGSAEWNWGRWAASHNWTRFGDYTARGLWDFGDTNHITNTTLRAGAAARTTAPFAHGFVTVALGRARELGYPTDALLASVATFYTQTLETGITGFHHMASYVMPTVDSATGKIFASWPATQGAFSPAFNPTRTFTEKMGDLDHGYSQIACAAVANLPASAARAALAAECARVRQAVDMSVDPKWALMPR